MPRNESIRNYVLIGAAAISVILVASVGISTLSAKSADALAYKGVNREFWLTNMDNSKIGNTTKGLLPDMYDKTAMIVKKGDNVTIHFYNVENDTTDRHSFSIDGGPYAINVIVNGSSHADIHFIANQTGVWTYYCIFHEPLMKGELVVEPVTYDEYIAQQNTPSTTH